MTPEVLIALRVIGALIVGLISGFAFGCMYRDIQAERVVRHLREYRDEQERLKVIEERRRSGLPPLPPRFDQVRWP